MGQLTRPDPTKNKDKSKGKGEDKRLMLIQQLVNNLIIYLGVFISLEKTVALRKGQAIVRTGFLTDLAHYFFTQLLALMVLGQVWPLLQAGAGEVGFIKVVSEGGGAGAGIRTVSLIATGWPWWIQLGFMFLSNDIIAYFFHRACHRVNFLWKFHAIHHSSNELDWLAAIRFHPLEMIVSRSLKYLPLAVVGFSFAPFGAILFLDGLHGYFIHSNVRLKFGPVISRIIVTPQFHHWHHSHEVIDKNFGGLIPWLDVLFGTFYLGAGAASGPASAGAMAQGPTKKAGAGLEQWPSSYGSSEPVPKGYWKQLIYPFGFGTPSLSKEQEQESLAR